MAEKCLFSSKLSLGSIGQEEVDGMCVDWRLHPFHKLLSSTCCVPGLYPTAHIARNPIAEVKGNAEQCNINCSVTVLGLDQLGKASWGKRVNISGSVLQSEMGPEILKWVFFFYLCPYVFITLSLKTFPQRMLDWIILEIGDFKFRVGFLFCFSFREVKN